MKNLSILALAIMLAMPLVGSATNDPKADEKAQVVVGNARFTVLTPQMIRMEWAENGVFEDRASLTFVNRKLEVPAYFRIALRSPIMPSCTISSSSPPAI